MYYPEVPAEQSGSTYCSALESLYEFEVEKAKLSNIEEVKAVTDVLNQKPVYQLKYIQNTVQFYDADLQAIICYIYRIFVIVCGNLPVDPVRIGVYGRIACIERRVIGG